MKQPKQFLFLVFLIFFLSACEDQNQKLLEDEMMAYAEEYQQWPIYTLWIKDSILQEKLSLVEFQDSLRRDSIIKDWVADSAIREERMRWTVQLCTDQKYHELKSDLPQSELKIKKPGFKVDSFLLSNAKSDFGMSPHGDKLYTLYVRDLPAYLQYKSLPQPDNQVLIKETWTVQEVPENLMDSFPIVRRSQIDGKLYRPDQRSDLYVMFKSTLPELIDEGWVYGRVQLNPDETMEVGSIGRIKNCMNCHSFSKYDRMMGISENL